MDDGRKGSEMDTRTCDCCGAVGWTTIDIETEPGRFEQFYGCDACVIGTCAECGVSDLECAWCGIGRTDPEMGELVARDGGAWHPVCWQTAKARGHAGAGA